MTDLFRTRLLHGAALAAAALFATAGTAPLQARSADQGSAVEQPARAAGADRRICVRMEMPNTRLSRRVCRTQAEWDRLGGVPQGD